MSPKLKQRLIRVARIIDRSKRWSRLAFMNDQEVERLLLEYDLRHPKEEEDEDKKSSMDDGSYPAGPRNDHNKSRYKLEPGHGQDLSSLLRITAATRAINGIKDVLKNKDAE